MLTTFAQNYKELLINGEKQAVVTDNGANMVAALHKEVWQCYLLYVCTYLKFGGTPLRLSFTQHPSGRAAMLSFTKAQKQQKKLKSI